MDGAACRRNQWRLGLFLLLMMVCETWLIYVVMEGEHRAARAEALARSLRAHLPTPTLAASTTSRNNSILKDLLLGNRRHS